MRKHLLGAASVFVLLTGTALAQNAATGDNAAGQPGAAAPTPPAATAMPSPTARRRDAGAGPGRRPGHDRQRRPVGT